MSRSSSPNFIKKIDLKVGEMAIKLGGCDLLISTNICKKNHLLPDIPSFC